jgi:homoserine kinase
LIKLILTTNKHRIEEHYDNVAFVILGTIEISEDNKDYIKALEEKYEALRDKVLIMGLKDEMKGEWKRYVKHLNGKRCSTDCREHFYKKKTDLKVD